MGNIWKTVKNVWTALLDFAESCKSDTNDCILPPESEVGGHHIYLYTDCPECLDRPSCPDCPTPDDCLDCPDRPSCVDCPNPIVEVSDDDDDLAEIAEPLKLMNQDEFEAFMNSFVRARLGEIPAQGCCNNCSPEVMQEHIAQKAYFLWEAAGKPDGRSDEFWQQAKEALTSKAENIDLEFEVYVEPLVRHVY
jgi:hypothetical protein